MGSAAWPEPPVPSEPSELTKAPAAVAVIDGLPGAESETPHDASCRLIASMAWARFSALSRCSAHCNSRARSATSMSASSSAPTCRSNANTVNRARSAR